MCSLVFISAKRSHMWIITSLLTKAIRHTLMCFTKLRTKQVIQTIPSLELCCGSANSF